MKNITEDVNLPFVYGDKKEMKKWDINIIQEIETKELKQQISITEQKQNLLENNREKVFYTTDRQVLLLGLAGS